MAEQHDPYVSLRNPNFRWYVASLVAVTLGTQIQATVVAWQVYALTKDPLSLGIVGLAEALPFIGAALYAGHVADRHNRKTLALIAIAIQVLCGVALLVLTIRSDIFLAGKIWPIYAVVAASGLSRSFFQPARTALGADIVPRETYANAVTWRSSLWQFAAVVGPALGGVIYGFSGPRLAYIFESVLCAIGLGLFARIAYTRHPMVANEGSIGENLTIGIRFLLTQPQLLGAQVLDLFSVLFGGAPALLPIFASEILHVGPQGLGSFARRPQQARCSSQFSSCIAGLEMQGPRFSLRCGIRCVLDSLRLVAFVLAVPGSAAHKRDARQRECRDPIDAAYATNSAAHARTSFRREPDFHRIVERDRVVRIRCRREAARNGQIGDFGGIMTLGVVGVTAWKIPALRKLDALD